MAFAARLASAIERTLGAMGCGTPLPVATRRIEHRIERRTSTKGLFASLRCSAFDGRRSLFAFDTLEPRCLFSAALDLIGVNALRDDPVFDGIDGSGMTVVVIDTGVDFSHPKLADSKITEKDIVYGGTTQRITDSHGTHVAGIIAARDDNIGVATDVGLIGIQVFTESRVGGIQAYDADIEKALKWVYDNAAKYNIVAVNMSLGSGNYLSAAAADDNILYDDVKRLEGAGITVVSAAGNSYAQLQKQGSASPAVFSTLDVGAVYETNEGRRSGSGGTDYTTDADRLTYFSQRPNTGNQLFAPGAYITSTVPGGKTMDLAGTSMAAPMVTGVVALMQEAAVQFGGRKLSTSEIQSILRQTADPIVDGDDEDTSVRTTGQTYLRVNAYNALKAVRTLFTGGGNTGETDPTGTIAGAVLGPALTANESTPINGNIGTDGSTSVGGDDVDLYRINVTSPGEVEIEVDANGFTPVIRIFSASGTPVATVSADGAGGFSYDADLLAGIYYVGISSSPNSTYNPNVPGSGPDGDTGTYSLTFKLDTADADGVLSGATDISIGTGSQATTGNIGLDGSKSVGGGDVDFYRVTVPDDGTLLVDIDTNGSSYPDTYVRVFDEDGNQKSFSDDDLAEDITGTQIEFRSGLINVVDGSGNAQGHKTDSFIGGAVTKGTVYYIAVANYENRAFSPTDLEGRIADGDTGGYSLFVSFRNADVNGAIPQAVNAVALPLTKNPGEIGSDGSNTGLVSVGDRDVDFIKLNSPTAGLLKIDIDSHANADDLFDKVDAVVRLFDGSGNLLAINDNGPDGLDPLLYYEISANTNYFLAVSGKGNDNFDPFLLGSGGVGDTGEYYFSASVLSNSVGDSLTDDTASSGGVGRLFLDDPKNGTLGDDGGFAKGDGDIDLYHFTAPFTGEYTLTAGPDDAFGADTYLRLFDAAGNELASNDNGDGNTGGSKIVFTLSGGQAYLIGVTGAGPNAENYDPINGGSSPTGGDTGGYTVNITAGERFIAFGPENKAVYTDADGSEVVISLIGPGNGSVFFNGDGNLDATRILLENTTDKTIVSIRGSTTVGPITVSGSVKAIAGREVTVTGDVTVLGTVRSLTFGGVVSSQIVVSGGTDGLTFVASNVTDSSINSTTPIKSLKVTSWLDSDGDDVIVARAVQSLTCAGNFGASIDADVIGKIKIGGQLSGDVVSLGNVESITADTFGDAKILVGLADGTSDIPDAAADFINPGAVLKSLVIKSKAAGAFGRSIVAAPTVRKATFGDATSAAGAATFGMAFDFGKSVRGSVNGTPLKLKDLSSPADSAESGEFVVRVV